MSREPEEIDPIADARNEIVAIAAFSAWWTPLARRMHWARQAAPHAADWQGPPFLNRQFHGPLARSLAARTARAKTAAQLRYLVARSARNGA